MAVLQRSERNLRFLLGRNTFSGHEVNGLGQSALHLCGDWATGTKILLAAGYDTTLKDCFGKAPLDYALAFEGTEAASV